MTILNFLNFAVLTVGPIVVTQRALLSETSTEQLLWTQLQAFVLYLATALGRLLAEGLLPLPNFIAPLFAFFDVGALSFLLRRRQGQVHVLQVGLAWALADSLVRRLVPIWVEARGPEFVPAHVDLAFEATLSLPLALAESALVATYWRRGVPRELQRRALIVLALLASSTTWFTRWMAPHGLGLASGSFLPALTLALAVTVGAWAALGLYRASLRIA